jgi:hypothetical protein
MCANFKKMSPHQIFCPGLSLFSPPFFPGRLCLGGGTPTFWSEALLYTNCGHFIIVLNSITRNDKEVAVM